MVAPQHNVLVTDARAVREKRTFAFPSGRPFPGHGSRRCARHLALLCATVAASLSGLGLGAAEEGVPNAVVTAPLAGVCYSPFRTGQNPDCGVLPTVTEIRQDLQFVERSGLTKRLRTYSSTGTLGAIPALCTELGLECWPGAWLSRYPGPTEREISALIEIGQRQLPNCPVLIVGNEVLLREDMSEGELLSAIARVKKDTGLAVAYAEIADVWLRHPKVAAAVDVMLVHLYPFWEGQAIADAPAALLRSWQRLRERYPDTRIVVGETGWPAAGEAVGRARPSGPNQAQYLADVLQITTAHDIDYFYFALFSEEWKAGPEGDRGAHWGLFAADGKPNPAVADLLPQRARRGDERQPGKPLQVVTLTLPAYVYRDGGAPDNRFKPTNWMGDIESLVLDEHCADNPHSGVSCTRFGYRPGGWQAWAGIYWVGPYFNHWGDYPGYEVNDARAVTFWARGANGGERVEFKVGGMRDRRKPFRDSFGPLPVRDTWVTLTAQWKLYTIGLGDADTSSLLGGFCVVTNAANNPDGCTVFLDGIRVVGNGE